MGNSLRRRLEKHVLILIRNNSFQFDNFIFTFFNQVNQLNFNRNKKNELRKLKFLFFSARNPQTWVKPYAGEAVYNYKATSPHELSIYAGQLIQLAPREVQQTHKLLNTGWALATVDNKTSGLVPINYVRRLEAKQFAAPSTQTSSTTTSVTENQPDPNIIASDVPFGENVMEKDKIAANQSNFTVEDANNQMYENKLPTNEIINESTHIDPVILNDMKDL